MKKILLLLSLILCLSLLVACGSSEKKEETKTEPTVENPTAEQPTEEQPKEDDGIKSTEINFGFYNLVNSKGQMLGGTEANGKSPAFDITADDELMLEKLNTWTIEPKTSAKGDLVYNLYCTYDPHVLVEPEKLIPGKTIVTSGYEENDMFQQWIISKNEDGTFKILSYRNPRFCLTTGEDGTPILGLIEEAGPEANWTITEKTSFDRFIPFYSENRKVIFQLPKNIINAAKITPERIQQFAEDTVTMYETYIDLTGFVTYDHIILKAYDTEEYIAYVINGYMCVSADKEFIIADLKRMAERTDKHNVRDVNFMMLHEMGHMFDRNQKWSFEGEAMTDIKAPYILASHPEFVAAPSEFQSKEYFNAATITEAYKKLGGASMNGTKDGYSIYCCAAIFVDIIQKDIKDWSKVKEMYHWYSANQKDIDPIKWYREANGLDEKASVVEHVARLDMYIAKLTEYTGVDVRSLIKENDYKSMYLKCGGK